VTVPGTASVGLRPNRKYATDRVCEAEDCQTILSRYNPDPHCSLHRIEHEPDPPDLRGPHLGDR